MFFHSADIVKRDSFILSLVRDVKSPLASGEPVSILVNEFLFELL